MRRIFQEPEIVYDCYVAIKNHKLVEFLRVESRFQVGEGGVSEKENVAAGLRTLGDLDARLQPSRMPVSRLPTILFRLRSFLLHPCFVVCADNFASF